MVANARRLGPTNSVLREDVLEGRLKPRRPARRARRALDAPRAPPPIFSARPASIFLALLSHR